jgi:hypothetical protein
MGVSDQPLLWKPFTENILPAKPSRWPVELRWIRLTWRYNLSGLAENVATTNSIFDPKNPQNYIVQNGLFFYSVLVRDFVLGEGIFFIFYVKKS